MALITGDSNNFISAEQIYSKIKREFKTFGSVNLLDDSDFPEYTFEVLRKIGAGVYKEQPALLNLQNGKACLPHDFMILHSAYKCDGRPVLNYNTREFDQKTVIQQDITCDIIGRKKECIFECKEEERLIKRVTIKKYIDGEEINYHYNNPILLRLSPNVRSFCAEDCPNLFATTGDEITINNKQILANFPTGKIYINYYGLALDENGYPMIPENVYVEKAIEWFIKYQIMLNYWLVDDLPNAQGKWQKAEQMYKEAMAEAQFDDKLPTFAKMVDDMRINRQINKVTFFSQQDPFRI